MPEETIASAVSRMSFSSMSQAKVFQLFHPMGGVSARPANFCADADADTSNKTSGTNCFMRPPSFELGFRKVYPGVRIHRAIWRRRVEHDDMDRTIGSLLQYDSPGVWRR